MSQVAVTRWTRYNHDRLYVSVDGTQVGYYDLKTGTAHATDPTNTGTIETAGNDWKQANPPVVEPPEPPADEVAAPSAEEPPPVSRPLHTPATEPAPSIPEPTWSDLATTAPGAAARAQAQALKAEAPVRTFLARALGVKTNERAWRIGADGEEAVAAQLTKLGPRWRALHAVPVGAKGSDIDHVLIGPAGVYTLNSKHHPSANVWVFHDAFKVNGQSYKYVRNSRFEARRATKLLSTAVGAPVFATGVIVVLGAHKGFTVKAQPDDVQVVARKGLVRWLTGLPEVLNDAQVAEIWEHARRSTTWT